MFSKSQINETTRLLKAASKAPVSEFDIGDAFILSVMLDEYNLLFSYEEAGDIPVVKYRLTSDGKKALKMGFKKYIEKQETEQSIMRYTKKHNTLNTVIASVALIVAILALFFQLST